MTTDLTQLLSAATEIARAGGDHTLQYFNTDLEVSSKSDNTPVTIADKEAEQLMRDQIEARFPSHGILGEELGAIREDASVQWILDPIDGTLSFIHGVPLYTTLIGILIDKVPQVGVIYAPAQQECCAAATGLGATLNGTPCSVRSCDSLSKATFLTTDTGHIKEFGFQAGYDELCKQTPTHRTWGDAYGHMLVATGRADLMFDPILNIWDAAALLPVIQEAGGVFSDAAGNARIDTGSAVSCGPSIHAEVIQTLATQDA